MELAILQAITILFGKDEGDTVDTPVLCTIPFSILCSRNFQKVSNVFVQQSSLSLLLTAFFKKQTQFSISSFITFSSY
jgi:hypothetical protein